MSTTRKGLETKAAVLVLNYNGWRDTLACIETLLQLDRPVGIFVIDNCSTDESVERIRIWAREVLPGLRPAWPGRSDPVPFREFRATPDGWPGPDAPPLGGTDGAIALIETGRNLGYAGGNNVGLRFALREDYDHVWVLNNDTEVAPDALSRLVDRMEADPRIGMCGSTLLFHGRPDLIQNLGGGRFSLLKGRSEAIGMGDPADRPLPPDEVERRLSFVSGASMLVRRDLLETVGLMEEGYFLFWEEIEWAARARGRYRLGFAPGSVVRHKVGASIGTRDFAEQSELAEFYMARNRLRFCARYAWPSLPFALADTARQILRRCCRGDWRRARLLVHAALGRHLRDGRPVRTR